jgi:hypothetical protein
MTTPRSSPSSGGAGKWIVAALVILLLILHQDNWNWTSDTLVFGFVPIGLFYHACLSVGAAVVWFLATQIAWPVETIQQTLEQTDEEVQP